MVKKLKMVYKNHHDTELCLAYVFPYFNVFYIYIGPIHESFIPLK